MSNDSLLKRDLLPKWMHPFLLYEQFEVSYGGDLICC